MKLFLNSMSIVDFFGEFFGNCLFMALFICNLRDKIRYTIVTEQRSWTEP